MKDFIISTESNSDLAPEYISKNNICVIPHYYSIDEEVYGDTKELSIRDFYNAMREEKKAATMASNPAVIREKFETFAKEGKDILHISFSSELSGGFSNVVMVSNEIMEDYPDVKIVVLDTLSASLGEGILIMKAVSMREEGHSLDETISVIQELIPHVCAHFTVDDLNHLYRGGRLSKTTAMLGSMLNVKPILYLNEEGKLLALSKTRGRKKSISMLADNMEERLGSFRSKQIAIGILHGDCEEDANYLASLIRERFQYDNIIIRPIGPSIGAHSGPGALALVFLGDKK